MMKLTITPIERILFAGSAVAGLLLGGCSSGMTSGATPMVTRQAGSPLFARADQAQVLCNNRHHPKDTCDPKPSASPGIPLVR